MATGDDCGGKSVADRFCNMLDEIVGKNVTTELKRKEPMAWLDMLKHFRIKIERFKTSNTTEIRLRYPLSLNEICLELHGKDLNSLMKWSSYVNEITEVKGIFKFKADLIIKLVTPTIDSIFTLMKNTVSNR
jgi:hypothetical protein